MSRPRILYLDMVPGEFVQETKLSGIGRYAAARGWEAVSIPERDSRPDKLKALLSAHRPVGCVVECTIGRRDLPPRLFGAVPVVYLDAYASLYGPRAARVAPDDGAIVRAAMRELSAGRPAAYAFVGYYYATPWERAREKAFRLQAKTTGNPFRVFRHVPADRNDHGSRTIRLAAWLSTLPRHCAVMAVNDQIAANVALAASRAGLGIPYDLTLVGVDNNDSFLAKATPAITTVLIDYERAGFLAARMLGEQMGWGNHRLPSIAIDCRRTDCSRMPSNAIDKSAPNVFGPLMVIRRESTRGFGRREPYILDAVEIIRREACDGLTPAKLVARMPGSRRHFEQRFREAMGHSILDEIQTVQLEKVCTLLAQTDTTIEAIADFCGFGSGRALRDLFRARFKMSMREYRMRSRG
ncbi:MAG: substrate-binding domain-containing protein [Kiritimatiellae bacterium]|nr:substrate-binding domain-containing protein [Kiritimatiellia bacterium]